MTNLGIDRKRLRQLTLPLRETEVLPLGGAVVAPSTEGAPTRAPNEQEVSLVMAAETRPPKISDEVRAHCHEQGGHAQHCEVLHDALWGPHRSDPRRR